MYPDLAFCKRRENEERDYRKTAGALKVQVKPLMFLQNFGAIQRPNKKQLAYYFIKSFIINLYLKVINFCLLTLTFNF